MKAIYGQNAEILEIKAEELVISLLSEKITEYRNK
jgi:hypothetical protein